MEYVVFTLEERKAEISAKSALKWIKHISFEVMGPAIIETVYTYTRPKRNGDILYMVELCCALGHRLMRMNNMPLNSACAAKLGAFICYSFEYAGWFHVALRRGRNGHQVYAIEVDDDERIVQSYLNLKLNRMSRIPLSSPFPEWTSTRQGNFTMVKTRNTDVLDEMIPETHPLVFGVVNKAQKTGWRINKHMLKVGKWAFKNHTDAFRDVWGALDPTAKATKVREIQAILDIASRINGIFYHRYFLDFRGRKVPASAYLHEQGNDFSRSLLLRADSKPLGPHGYQWLMISLASLWGGKSDRSDGVKTDKMPLHERFVWAEEHEEELLGYAEEPSLNRGWMYADKPWRFLAACMTLGELRLYQHRKGNYEDYGFECAFEGYIDGSNNGAQHLCALMKDEIVAPHVNLTPAELPGDLYGLIAITVWETISQIVEETPEADRDRYNSLIDELLALKTDVGNTVPRSQERRESVLIATEFRKKHRNEIKEAAPFFWYRIKDTKNRRKIVKRKYIALVKESEFRGSPKWTILSQARVSGRCNDYSERKYTQVGGSALHSIRMMI